jgi:hypothetical protein
METDRREQGLAASGAGGPTAPAASQAAELTPPELIKEIVHQVELLATRVAP